MVLDASVSRLYGSAGTSLLTEKPSLANLDATISRNSFGPFDSEWIWLEDTPYDLFDENPSLFFSVTQDRKCSFDVFT